MINARDLLKKISILESNQEFKNVASGYYWASTQDSSREAYAWNIDFNYGKTESESMLNEYYVHCVRDDDVD